ncbi:hypothetical protein ACFPK9_10690 [Rubritalea spongiae]|uniref:Uncharacterized protein n=1 Tax=Rubritalea spongiae TaxID=430797 RepID=A0ABW5DYF3_9BACT
MLSESSRCFSLDGLREPEAKPERDILTGIFFDLDDEDVTTPKSHRQATLGLVLHVLAAYEEVDSVPARKDIDQSCIFWPHYYGELYIEGGASRKYHSHPCFEDTQMYWRQFSLHQFYLYATEQFLQAMIDAMGNQPEGVTMARLVELMLESDFVEELERVMECKIDGPADLLDFFGAGDSPRQVQQHFSCDHPLSEAQVYYQHSKVESSKTPVTRLGRAFTIWAQLYAKWRDSDDPALLNVLVRANREWCIGTAFEWGDQWLDEKPNWSSALEGLVRDFQSRHNEIYLNKGKLDAAWFEVLGGCFIRVQDLKPNFRSTRHPQVATILQDLCLLEDGGPHEVLKLTAEGYRVLTEVITARS